MNSDSNDLFAESDSYDKKSFVNDEDLLDYFDSDFSYTIKERGRGYYSNGNVLQCIKNENQYIAKVRGSMKKPYTVSIMLEDDYADYECDCPYDGSCKHVYATLLAIDNGEYKTVKLKKKIPKKKSSLQDLIKNIPAEDLKKYMLSTTGMNSVKFEMNSFEEYFINYFPVQPYEYYYNNLYNAIEFGDDFNSIVQDYLKTIESYVTNFTFAESFKIIKAIIESYNNCSLLSFSPVVTDLILKLGIYLKVSFKYSDDFIRKNISNYVDNVKSNNYYGNAFLKYILTNLE